MAIRYDEKGKYFTEFISKETVPVLIQTAQHRLEGQYHVQPKERLKDALNQPHPFLALTDVTVYDSSEAVLYHTHFLAVNKDHVLWVIPADDIETGPCVRDGA